MESIASRWRALSGENDWEGLLDPLDYDLRRYIIHYGERAEAAEAAFIGEVKSENVGLPRYPKSTLFSKVGLELGNPFKYIVKRYIYASTSGIAENDPKGIAENSNWIGFVAVSTDQGSEVLGRRDILISWRGTIRKAELTIDKKIDLVSAPTIFGSDNNAKIHHGWYSYYTTAESGSTYNSTSSQDQVREAVSKLIEEYKEEEISITVTGHSMGGALAILNATDIVFNGFNKPTTTEDKVCPVTAIVFASPRLGDQGFSDLFSGLENLHVLRVRNEKDKVPDLPPGDDYVHVGKELIIDTTTSPYLKSHIINLKVHELEIYLHGVAGPKEVDGKNELVVDRDIAWVNKQTDEVKDEYNFVANWWVKENKSMVQMDDGKWVLNDRDIAEEDDYI
ncbi:phospholipase A1-IIgamma [Ziziphus jujuba]|uniref:Phospholipase A1 n=1 Tax=Ziziphus jujuba TaxID=326968 RepID=A0ABM3IHC0_ZIZJJ|nr:phospholipase A1-IIgamma [Ziziphus jujuba]